MTLRTIESQFTEMLLGQEMEKTPYHLTIDGPISPVTHPKVAWAQILFKNNPQQEPVSIQIPNWNFECFGESTIAVKKYQQISQRFEGRPWNIHQFLSSGHDEAIIDFKALGTVVLSKKPLAQEKKNDLCDHTLPHWLNYALSPELWGPNGKWPRFHEKITKILKQKDLLVGKDLLGYYPLKIHAKKLESFGFIGSEIDQSYCLVLPWSFSLTALKLLEEVLEREF